MHRALAALLVAAAGAFAHQSRRNRGQSSASYRPATSTAPNDPYITGRNHLFDFLAFLNAFNPADPSADCDGNAGLDLFDFLCYTNAFNAGC